jgi:hypothetical protein
MVKKQLVRLQDATKTGGFVRFLPIFWFQTGSDGRAGGWNWDGWASTVSIGIILKMIYPC